MQGILSLSRDLLDDALVGARRGRRLKPAVGRVLQAFLRPKTPISSSALS